MAGFRFNSRFSTPYYEGGATTTLAPYITEVALGGHPYRIDWLSEIPLRHVSIPILRNQQDTSDSPGEQSINPESLWRRIGESWHLGAGQERYDRKESSPFRFRSSKGVNVWNKWELSLLNSTDEKLDSTNTNLRMAVAGAYLYVTDGASIKYTQDITVGSPTWTDITGEPGTAPTSIASNGNRIWTAHGSAGVYMTQRGTGSTASHITGTVDIIDYVKNRVMAAGGASIYDVTSLAVGASGALPAALFTHGNTDWTWKGFAESQGFIYAAGSSGDKSLIYSITIVAEGTALASPTVAGALPDGELVTAIYGYLGRFLAIGTNKGFRLALVGQTGGLTIGSLIVTPQSVLCFEGQEEFIWFGWSGYSTTAGSLATGLGRMNTGSFSNVDLFTPAYASDLMVDSETAAVQSIVTFQNLRVFGVTGEGVYAEDATTLVSSATLDTGNISYGLTELKTALYLDVQYADNGATNSLISPFISTDGSAFVAIDPATTNGALPSFTLNEKVGSEFEIRLKITATTPTNLPNISILSWLLRSQPRPVITNVVYATVFLAPVIESLVDTPYNYVTVDELDFLEGLNLTKEVVSWQENNRNYQVVLEDYELNIKGLIDSPESMSGFNGSCTLKMKRV